MSKLSLLEHPMLYYKHKWHRHRFKYGKSPDGFVIKEFNGVKFPLHPSLREPLFGEVIKYFYFDYYEPDVVRLMKKYLKPGGLFIDIGANVGYLTAIGASLVGKRGQVYSFEPVKTYFDYLQRVVELNCDYKIVVENFALGEKTEEMCIVINKLGSSLVAGFVHPEHCGEKNIVQVKRLDEYIVEKQLVDISLIKIDTEGFELPVILGASRFFEMAQKKLPFIIVEITPYAYRLMNKGVDELYDIMKSFGYKSYATCGCHPVDIRKLTEPTNVLFKP